MTARSPGAAQHPGHRGPAQPIREGLQGSIEAGRLRCYHQEPGASGLHRAGGSGGAAWVNLNRKFCDLSPLW